VVLGTGALALVAAGLGGAVLTVVPRNGAALPARERAHLLERAGLPLDFPVHPSAQRATQPPQGGFTYTLNEPVPDVLSWYRRLMQTAGYTIFSTDLPGQDDYLPHWLYFRGRAGDSGAIIIRSHGRGFARGTEVKVLSQQDQRLSIPSLPSGAPTR
jgi:hypothetical protein